jgi:hypothetical protein
MTYWPRCGLFIEWREVYGENGAHERTRTSTSLRILAPEASASTNSATWARGKFLIKGLRVLSQAVMVVKRLI